MGVMDIQEISNTYHQITLARTRCMNSLFNHYITLYFPEMEQYFNSSRSEWFCRFLLKFPTPASIVRYRCQTFVKRAWEVVGRKVHKQRILEEYYAVAQRSIGLPVKLSSVAVQTFKLQLTRFGHYRQYLAFCGFNLSAQQSGTKHGAYRLSKRGNARLRYAFWLAATVAINLKENVFREKYLRYIQHNPEDKDLCRKGRVAVAAKMARVAHAVVKTNTNYVGFYRSEE